MKNEENCPYTCEGDFSGDFFGLFDGELRGEFPGDVSASKDGGSFVSHDDPALSLTEDNPNPCESPIVPNAPSSMAAAMNVSLKCINFSLYHIRTYIYDLSYYAYFNI
jgi:hypothetical protein